MQIHRSPRLDDFRSNCYHLPYMFSLTNVAYTYPHASAPAVHGLNVTLPAGSAHWLTGASGAGKTTLFRLLTLDVLPTQGSLTLQNQNVSTCSRQQRALLRRQLGVVYQDFRLLPHLTVAENVALPLAVHGLNPHTPKLQQAVADLLSWVGLTALANTPAGEISGGEQQRTAIARAVVHQPQVLVADEPTGNVDAAMARKIMHLFTQLHKQGTTLILATHDAALIRAYPMPRLHLQQGTLGQPEDTPDA
jgi:cell division transport system ATP-binding protein